MDYELEGWTRRCAATGRELKPGEPYFSAVVQEGDVLHRRDYAPEAWQGPPAEAIGWWKSQRPEAARARRWAPNDVMLEFFDRLESQPENQDLRYVLGLLLVRRRVMRLEEEEADAEGKEVLVLYCPRREATYRLPTSSPGPERINQIQQELERLLR